VTDVGQYIVINESQGEQMVMELLPLLTTGLTELLNLTVWREQNEGFYQ
jgi:hypothetical protein